MIINIRGTSGSGKSTIVRKIIKKAMKVELLYLNNKISNYKLEIPGIELPIFIVGKYETPCGGCDTIKTQDEIRKRIRKFSKQGHVIFEGLLVSGCYDKYVKMFKRMKADYHFIYLNTKLETCIESVEKRRKARGNDKPLNPKNTESKYKANLNCIKRSEKDGSPHSVISRNKAVEKILCLLKEQNIQTIKSC